ncbi:MAG: DUF3426 domain-containing protein [Burkholderiaceae bacterium]|nr:DUF3426 domain-containing protein [Burkholderiaceae bacterium]
MALATQCPHCKTTFRVAQDQLKLRAGLVRCGACKEIFNGVEHLLPADSAPAQATPTPLKEPDAPRIAMPAPAATPAAASTYAPQDDSASAGIPISILVSTPAPTAAALDFIYPEPHPEAEPESPVAPEAAPEDEPEPEQPAAEAVEFVDFVEVPRQNNAPGEQAAGATEAQPEDPLQRMTLIDFSDTEPSAESDSEAIDAVDEPAPVAADDGPDPLDQVIDELKRKPLRGSKKKAKAGAAHPTAEATPEPDEEISEPDEPEFVKQGRRKQTLGRKMRIAMWCGSFVLLLAGLGQATYAFRDQLAARVPEAKPLLAAACTWLDCRIELPAQIEAITIESDTLETLPANKDASELSMLLRNSSTTVQAWPYLELTLNDANNTLLSRRVFAPHDYLPAGQDEKKGIASNSEPAIKLYLEFSGVKPSGYHVGVFYP